MKKKFLAILLGALMLVSMIPAMGAFASTATTNLIPNGNFENEFTTFGYYHKPDGTNYEITQENVPASGWSIQGCYSTPVWGNVTRVAKEDFATPVAGSNYSLKIERVSEGTDQYYGVWIPLHDGTSDKGFLESGKTYKLTFYYNMPDGVSGTGLHVGICDSYSSVKYAAGLTKLTAATNGWVKCQYYFTYTANTSAYIRIGLRGASTPIGDYAYVDEMILTETNEVFDFDFNEYTAGNAADNKFKQYTSRPVTYEVDPTDGSNICLKGGAHKNALNLFPVTPAASASNANAVYKLSGRFYVPTLDSVSITDEAPLTLYARITTDEVMVRTGPSLKPADLDKWHNFEIYFNGPTASISGYFEMNYATELYLDDIVLEKLVDEAYISSFNAEFATGTKKAGAMLYIATNTGAATTQLRPIAVYNPSDLTTANGALAISAVYKTEGTKRTLLDVKIVELGKTASSAWGSGIMATSGGISAALTLDLSTVEGETDVEYYIWDKVSLAPLANSVITLD